jgi:YHS domain-containing protein
MLLPSSTDNTAVLDGFVITAGKVDDTFYQYKYSGGGMINYFGSPTLKNIFFSGNSAYCGGGCTTKKEAQH